MQRVKIIKALEACGDSYRNMGRIAYAERLYALADRFRNFKMTYCDLLSETSDMELVQDITGFLGLIYRATGTGLIDVHEALREAIGIPEGEQSVIVGLVATADDFAFLLRKDQAERANQCLDSIYNREKTNGRGKSIESAGLLEKISRWVIGRSAHKIYDNSNREEQKNRDKAKMEAITGRDFDDMTEAEFAEGHV